MMEESKQFESVLNLTPLEGELEVVCKRARFVRDIESTKNRESDSDKGK
jgi:hypothetical protein